MELEKQTDVEVGPQNPKVPGPECVHEFKKGFYMFKAGRPVCPYSDPLKSVQK